jgi:glutamate 5-kinase
MSHIVLKFGTGVLSRSDGRALDGPQFRRIATEVAALIEAGHSCVIVSSAAIAAGVHALGLSGRPVDLPGKQACAAAGQPELMRLFATSFRRHGITVAQLLLTHEDIDSRTRRKNARNTLDRLLAAKSVVPIINENDTVALEEIRFGDNDQLSAEVAHLVEAKLLLLLTSSDGLNDADGKRISVVRKVSDVRKFVRPDTGAMSVGGMGTKLDAIESALSRGIAATILDGRQPAQIAAAVAGQDVGTRFSVPRQKKSRRS